MRNVLLSILVVLLTVSFIADVHAKRFGGGSSFGMKRNVSSFSRYNSNPSRMQQPIAKPASPTNGMSKWLGPLAGLAMGGLLASLFMGHGVGTGILSWLVIIGGALFLWRLFSSRLQSTARPAQHANYQAQSFQNFSQPFSTAQTSPLENSHSEVQLNGFDEAAFLRQAKASFIRLQAAYDNKNLADIREFTTPEVFAEIQLQLQERGSEENHTEVVNIESELLDVSNESNVTLASTLFSGLIREQKGAEPVTIKEIWHFKKDIYSQNWAVAGIQQA